MEKRALRMAGQPEFPAGRLGSRTRRRWRFQPRGLIGLVLLAFFAINLYVLADNIVRLIKQRQARVELDKRLRELERNNRYMQQYRDWMESDDYLREQARSLGYAAPGETLELAPPEPPADGDNPVIRRRDRPCQPY